ncbi:MAG: S8 family serine peptidase [Pyrinomonadaceae bacterium]
MNRQNFLGHLMLALTIIIIAAFAGQVRHLERLHLDTQPDDTALEAQTETPDNDDSDNAEVIVRFRKGTSVESVENIVANHNDEIEDQIEAVDEQFVIEDEDGLDAEAVAAEYAALPEVEYAEPNYEIELEPGFESFRRGVKSLGINYAQHKAGTQASVNSPNDPMFSDQWSLANTGQREGKANADIGALRAWTKTHGSDHVVIAVLDSGVDYTHPDLMQNIWTRPAGIAQYTDEDLGTIDDLHGFSAISDDPMDENGHGTHCAGIIGAEGDNDKGIAGVNWQVEIMPLKFMSAGGFGTTKDAIECINYVINRKRAGVNVRVISASWGSTLKSKALKDAIREAGEAGILFIAASGNAGADSDKSPHYPAGYDLPNMISVAALNRKDELASFSNYGAKSVHVAAPGSEILSTWLNGSFEEHSGTSMATPEVAGVAGLVLAASPEISMTDLRERILKSVDPLPSLHGKISSGGRINAARAVGVE